MCLYPFIVKGNLASCGKCWECRQAYATEWSFRIAHEAKLYKDNCMITLTYNDEFLPEDLSVNKRTFQLFMKRLRKFVSPTLIRFFGCGEYGKKFGRPHYHIIIFNWKPNDLQFLKFDKRGHAVFVSKMLEKIWPYGFNSVVDVTQETARYCAKYLQKQVNDGRQEAFTLQSRKPAIGTQVITDEMIATDKVYCNGKYHALPQAFLNDMKKQGQLPDVERIKNERKARVFQLYSDGDYIDFDLVLQAVRKRKYKLRQRFGYEAEKFLYKKFHVKPNFQKTLDIVAHDSYNNCRLIKQLENAVKE